MRLIVVAIALSAALGACTSAPVPEAEPVAPVPAASAGLAGSTWQVFDIGGRPLVPDSAPSLEFTAARLSGMGSCNRFMGGYVLGAGGSIEISEMASTMMACPEPLMRQEDQYLKLLAHVRSYRIEADTLILTDPEGRSIRARKSAS